MKEKIDKFFGISENGSSFRIEITAGIVTFLAMAYILTLNPTTILYPIPGDDASTNITWASIFIATAFGAFIGTLLMAILAKKPLAQAPGIGLTFVLGTAMLGAVGGILFTFGQAMLLVLISGVIFLLLSIIPGKRDKETGKLIALREMIFDGMPKAIRQAIPIGIGLFIAFIGLKNANVIVANQGTFVDLVQLNEPSNWKQGGAAFSALVCFFGFVLIGVLEHFKVKGSVIIGILGAAVLAIPLGVADIEILKGNGAVSWNFVDNFKHFFTDGDNSAFLSVFKTGFDGWKSSMIMTSAVLVMTFCMIDMFDTMGTVVGCTTSAGLIDENGKPLNYNKIMISDSVATCAGSLLGTSTVTTFVESGAGIAAGGKTGVTALVASILFLLSLFIAPIFAFIPSAACASALVYVGVLMMKNVINIDFSQIKYSIPAFATILFMPLTYSITDGIGIGIVLFVIINLVIYFIDLIAYKLGKKEEKPVFEVSIVCLIIFALFLVYFLLPTSFN